MDSGQVLKEKIPLYLIIGFLGSGKTSLLNTIIEQQIWKRAGIIVNDFGSLNIDSSLLTDSSDIVRTELSGGQIFCSCLSGSFVDAVAGYASVPIDVLFVEASGLAKPNPLIEIMEWADRRSDHAFDFRGMLCVIDAERYMVLSQAVNAIKEQALYSDVLILNKCDLVSESTLDALSDSLQLIHPGIPIVRTTFGRVPAELLTQMRFTADRLRGIDPAEYRGWGASGRPISIRLSPAGAVPVEALQQFLSAASPKTFRIKGYVQTEEHGLILVNCVGSRISLETSLPDSRRKDIQPGFVVIADKRSRLELLIGDMWRELTGVDIIITA